MFWTQITPGRKLSVLSLIGIMLGIVVLAGCGGGGGPLDSTSGVATGQTLSFGNLITRIVGTVQPPVTASGSGVSITGVAGGDVTSLVLQDATPILSETQILFAEKDGAGTTNLFSISPDGGTEALLPGTNFAGNPAWALDGSKLALSQKDNSGHFHIVTMNADGTGVKRITNDLFDDIEPSWSRDGKTIVFSRKDREGHPHVTVANADGTGVQQITSGTTDDLFPVISPKSDLIVFQRNVTGFASQIFAINVDGSGLTHLVTSTFNDSFPSLSPDGSLIAFNRLDASARRHIFVQVISANQTTQLTGGANDNDFAPAWSPDGKKLAFIRGLNSFSFRLVTMNADGSGQTQLSSSTALLDRPAWSPFVTRRTLLGTNGLLGASAAGFLFGQKGKSIRNVVSFDTGAGLRTTAKVTSETGNTPGIPNVVFDITADSLTSLAFAQSPDFRRTTVIGTGGAAPTATGAIISYDATDGSLAFILPFTANRSAAAKTAALEGGMLVYRRSFIGVWDASGKNLAPNGANEVRLDVTTGKIVSVR